MSTFETTRSAQLGPSTRPVAIPHDFPAGRRPERGVIELPLSVRWSGPRRTYDLAERHDRVLVYEKVLAEGTADDVRRFIDVDDLVDIWDELVLPRHVRRAWEAWLRRCAAS